jgi:MOSC domain-containing protein YiiM
MNARVLAVHCKALHEFSKDQVPEIELVAGHGVRGDAHFGVTVKHRSRVARDPKQPNLRQVHLLQEELLMDVLNLGLAVAPGQMGENITTRGIHLLSLSMGTRLRLGSDAIVEVTGLRNPCAQIEAFKPGLLAAVLDRSPEGCLIRKAGVMAVVLQGGVVKAGDDIEVAHEPPEFKPLQPV